MATVVAVMDGPSWGHNTDVLVVADPARRSLLWVPRDLWCDKLGTRINKAYALAGHEGLVGALAEHGVRARHGICVRPEGIEAALGEAAFTVPIRERMEFDYDGWVRFDPPVEVLSGERIHAWVGARTRRPGIPQVRLPDLDRLRRQQELVAVMIGDGFDFRRFVADGLPVRVSGEMALSELRQVRWNWSFQTLDDVEPAERDGAQVLVRPRD
ncbi:MAG: hypothetical protein ACR2G3_07120 [Solirubrobacterales bacterium]